MGYSIKHKDWIYFKGNGVFVLVRILIEICKIYVKVLQKI